MQRYMFEDIYLQPNLLDGINPIPTKNPPALEYSNSLKILIFGDIPGNKRPSILSLFHFYKRKIVN